jgi:hypothetical protein
MFIINRDLNRRLIGIYTPSIHWVVRGTGTPKDRDEVIVLQIDERSTSVMGECEIVTLKVRRLYSK